MSAKISQQQVGAVRTYLTKQVQQHILEKNKKDVAKLHEKVQPDFDKINKAFEEVDSLVKKFNLKHGHKTTGNYYPSVATVYKPAISWHSYGGGYNSVQGHMLTPENMTLMSEANGKIDLFILKVQLGEAGFDEVQAFLKELLA